MSSFNHQLLLVDEICPVGYIKGFRIKYEGRSKNWCIFKNYTLWPFFVPNFKSILLFVGEICLVGYIKGFWASCGVGHKFIHFQKVHTLTFVRAKFHVNWTIFKFGGFFETPLDDWGAETLKLPTPENPRWRLWIVKTSRLKKTSFLCSFVYFVLSRPISFRPYYKKQ